MRQVGSFFFADSNNAFSRGPKFQSESFDRTILAVLSPVVMYSSSHEHPASPCRGLERAALSGYPPGLGAKPPPWHDGYV
jgi:hypothetical protein